MKPDAEPEDKPKFAHLLADGGDDEGDEEQADDEEEEGEPAMPKAAGAYDFKACANDMMSAFQSGDIESLEMALEDLAEKLRSKK